ncbi:VLTF-2 [Cetacean poxvirus 1]|nr:VLTF-2 [Cetacean poxvirus 1]
MAAKRMTLKNVVITQPKAVYKPVKEKGLKYILPKYYRSLSNLLLKTNRNKQICWFCQQVITSQYLEIETQNNKYVGCFCSRICKDSFANMIKSHVALREEPKVTLLPLIFYENPNEIISVINNLREIESIYGCCYFIESDFSIQVSLRSLS